MWSLPENHSPRLDQWLHLEEDFYCDGPLTPARNSDSTDESLLSTPAESPALNIRDLLVDPDDYSVPMEYNGAPQDGILFLDDRLDVLDGAYFGGGCHPAHNAPGYHGTSYRGSTRDSPRQHRIQRRGPYPPPCQGTSKLPAPHNDQLDLEAHGQYQPSSAGPAYRRSPGSGDRLLDGDARTFAVYTPSLPAPAQMALPPSVFHRDLIHVETGERLRRLFNLPLGAPVNLSAVLDRADGSRPEVSLPLLAQLAIYGSENQMLTLQGIFQALKDRFRYYRETTEKAWQNSIRHVLSLRTVFVRVERQAHHAGKGAYWTLGTSSGDQYKRPRKRVTATGGDERKTPPAAPDRVSSPKVAANVCWPIPASPSPELRQTSPYLTPHKHDGHSESAQANIDPALPDRPLSFISFPPTAPSSRSDVNYVAGTREQSIEADPADRAGIRASRRLLSRSDSLPSSDPASTSPITSAKKGRRSRA